MTRPFLLTALMALATAGSVVAEVTTQLPRTARPRHYELRIEPDAPALRFRGHAGIDLDVLAPTSTLTLHALQLDVRSARLVAGGTTRTPRVAVDAARQTVTFTFDTPLVPGPARLEVDYDGVIGTQAVGLFALDYATGQDRGRALFTQFENSDARRMFPGWDEPSYKATFALEAVVPAAWMAVSNMPVASRTREGDGRDRVRFGTSPKMSTYLLFFALGDFERATAREGDTELGVVTRRGSLDQAAFALASSRDVLRELNDYFGVPYPLPKLDNVAAPGRSQFFGAMENWGAIFSFEHILLVDPAISTEKDRQQIFRTAAHEIAHQWFGNLVTMAWWDDLWLNEGFASWMEGRVTEKLHPAWNRQLAAVTGRQEAMDRDALVTTHPVVQHVETVEQVSQAFDSITYRKGEAVLRMLEGYVGADAWRDGVRSYMRRHAYGNTATDDFWREVETAAQQPVLAIAHDFTRQPGVPLVDVESDCVDGRTRLTLRQGEFSADAPTRKALAWRVPVLARLDGGAPARVLVTGGRAVLELPGCGVAVVNAGQTGYYRTRYAEPHRAQLVKAFATLPAVDQLGLLSDAWALGRAGYQPASSVLDLVAAVPADADPQVLSETAALLGRIDALYDGRPDRRARFRAFAADRLRPVLARVGWQPVAGESETTAVLRNDLIETLGSLGDPAVVAEARRRSAAGELGGGIRKPVQKVVARHADAAAWEQLRAAARAEGTPLVKDELYGLLASAGDPALARRALELAITDEPGETNSSAMVAAVAVEHPDLAFDFAVERHAEVARRVDATSASRFYPELASKSGDPAMVDKLRRYAEAHLAPESRREAQAAMAEIRDRARVRRERMPEIDAWIDRHAITVPPLGPLR